MTYPRGQLGQQGSYGPLSRAIISTLDPLAEVGTGTVPVSTRQPAHVSRADRPVAASRPRARLFSRMIVGWSLATHLRATLATEALEMAACRRGASLPGLIHHSDAGNRSDAFLAAWVEHHP